MRRVRVVKPNKIAAIYKATCELSNNANSVCIYKIHVSTKIYTRCLLKILFDISRGRAMLCYVHIYDDRNLSLNQLLVWATCFLVLASDCSYAALRRPFRLLADPRCRRCDITRAT